VPVSRGGKWRGNVVWACADCNHLKGSLTAEGFRLALEARLGTVVVFAGEADEEHPATLIRSVRSLGAGRGVIRVDPVAAERLRRAVLFVRSVGGRPSLTAGAPFSDGEIEIRRILEADDFGEAYTPEQRERDERLRQESSGH
jgi:hypothetical protein